MRRMKFGMTLWGVFLLLLVARLLHAAHAKEHIVKHESSEHDESENEITIAHFFSQLDERGYNGDSAKTFISRFVRSSDGMELSESSAATPIGIACRVCERMDCEQRAFPPLLQPLRVDQNVRGRSFYVSVKSTKR